MSFEAAKPVSTWPKSNILLVHFMHGPTLVYIYIHTYVLFCNSLELLVYCDSVYSLVVWSSVVSYLAKLCSPGAAVLAFCVFPGAIPCGRSCARQAMLCSPMLPSRNSTARNATPARRLLPRAQPQALERQRGRREATSPERRGRSGA